MSERDINLNTWRDYQERLQKIARRRYILSRFPLLGLYAGGFLLILVIIFYTGSWIFAHLEQGDQHKYDWITAYALPGGAGDGGICMAILVIHGEKLGIRARDIARYVVNYYFTS